MTAATPGQTAPPAGDKFDEWLRTPKNAPELTGLLTGAERARDEALDELDGLRVQLAIACAALRDIALGVVRDPSVAADMALVAVCEQPAGMGATP